MVDLWFWCHQVPNFLAQDQVWTSGKWRQYFHLEKSVLFTPRLMHISVTGSLLAKPVRDLNSFNCTDYSVHGKDSVSFSIYTSTWLNFPPSSAPCSCQWRLSSVCQSNLPGEPLFNLSYVTTMPWAKCPNDCRIPTICLSQEASSGVMFVFISSFIHHENRRQRVRHILHWPIAAGTASNPGAHLPYMLQVHIKSLTLAFLFTLCCHLMLYLF